MLELQSGEFGVILELTVYDHDSDAHAFTGTETVQAYAIKGGGSAVAFGSSVVHDSAAGILWVTVLEADVDNLTQGTYELRVKISGTTSALIPEPAEMSIGRGIE